jgi:hypothetical protein
MSLIIQLLFPLFFLFCLLNLTIMENDEYSIKHEKNHVENTYAEDGNEAIVAPTLHRQLKNRHIAMISIGGVIGMYSILSCPPSKLPKYLLPHPFQQVLVFSWVLLTL